MATPILKPTYFLRYSLLFITLLGAMYTTYINVPHGVMWFINALICISFIKPISLMDNKKENLWILYLFFVWCFIGFIRGALLDNDYWRWKMLIGNLFLIMLPFMCCLFTSPSILRMQMRPMLLFGLLFFPIHFVSIRYSHGVGQYLYFMLLYMLYIPLLPKRWRYITIIIFFIASFYDIGARSALIKNSIALLLALVLYLNLDKRWLFKVLHPIIMFFPIVLLCLGIAGIFNVFKFDQYIDFEENETTTELSADTRTGLYENVIASAVLNEYIIQGRTPARGYDSTNFTVMFADRGASEVSIHNIFTYYGLIGTVLYFLIFYIASWRAIFQSRNRYIPILGIFVSFRWIYAWIEDFSVFDIGYVFLWVMIAMCMSSRFRYMSDGEFRYWLNLTLPFGRVKL
ncbi:MAG: hypothetical protein SNH57_05615 [Rikenellaceae bacterium]